jgi:hypothetical protein
MLASMQEGFNEADLTRAPNGDIICAMRSGGRLGIRKAPIFPTPLYISRSSDEGQTWTPPVPIADRCLYSNVRFPQFVRVRTAPLHRPDFDNHFLDLASELVFTLFVVVRHRRLAIQADIDTFIGREEIGLGHGRKMNQR